MKPDSGYTEIFGQPLDKVRERVSYVPQRESVDWAVSYTHLTLPTKA